MRIALSTVRQVPREALGFESFTAGLIRSIEEADWYPTCGVCKEGDLIYNPEFAARKVTSPQDLFSLVLHQTLHIAVQTFIYGHGIIVSLRNQSPRQNFRRHALPTIIGAVQARKLLVRKQPAPFSAKNP